MRSKESAAQQRGPVGVGGGAQVLGLDPGQDERIDVAAGQAVSCTAGMGGFRGGL